MVGTNVLAEGDSDDDLALVVGEVGVHLGSGRIAGHVDADRDPEPVVGADAAVDELDPDGLEAEPGEGCGPADGDEELVTLGDRAVGEDETMGPVRTRGGLDPNGPGPEPEVDPVGGKGSSEGGRVVRMIAVVQPFVRVDEVTGTP